ncbi:MAG TPA: 2-amino-3,7-dideoxy-D-threo-hept-6-ulosonate synthase [Desulfobacteria bacterium]|nr:2-amino-3,7-dideoxy-D-threo-hept-6-ulosonate synthase [Desulfobacteria bacterium]
MTGKQIRLKRLFKYSDRLFIAPMDHGVTVGPMEGLTDMPAIVNLVRAGNADAIVVHKGLVGQITDYLGSDGCELIVHLSASTSLAPDPNHKELVSSVEHAIRLGATAISVHVNLGNAYESMMLKDLGMVAESCESWGMPLLAMMYVRDGSKESEYDPAKIKHAARLAEEVGADIVKVNYTGSVEGFAEVTGAVKIPVVIAGGPKMSSVNELLDMIEESVEAGARGVAIGRNLFQHPDPTQLARIIRQTLDKKPLRRGSAGIAVINF